MGAHPEETTIIDDAGVSELWGPRYHIVGAQPEKTTIIDDAGVSELEASDLT